MSHQRSLSYDTDDSNTSPVRQRYQDSPDRPTIYPPPPQYFSRPRPDEPVSPVSAAYRPASIHSRHSSRHGPSFDMPRRPIVIANNDGVPPLPPPHGTSPTREAYRPESSVTAGLDNFGSQSQGGGLDRIAREVADRNQRQSGVEAARGLPMHVDQANYSGDRAFPAQSHLHSIPRRPLSRPYADGGSSGSALPLAAGATTPGMATPHEFPYDGASSHQSMRSLPQSYYAMGQAEPYDDSPYQRPRPYSHHAIDDNDILPRNIVDDGDDGFMPEPKRRSILPLSRDRSREALGEEGSGKGAGAAAGAAGAAGAAAGGVLGGLFGRKQQNVSSSGSYNAVSSSEVGSAEKSEWLSRQTKGNNRMRWTVGLIIGGVLIVAIVAGVVGGVLGSKHSSSGKNTGANTNNAASDTATNGDLDINSAEIQSLMNNKNLHKVFPGMDYTPWGVQYPLCLTYPPSQNNVTRDMAVLSQLTNSVRLYGTDCNQTEMVLHAIDKLQLKDMKVWLGVWIDPNMTTTDRQIDQMYKILAGVSDRSIFKGVIIGNEALFRAGQDKAESQAELVTYLNSARSNFSSLGYDLSISTSDLGDNWDATLAQASDFVMSNIHPFFAGVNVNDAAAWSWNFWQTHDVVLTGKESNQVIAETGWPSGGGTDCGNTANVCAPGDTGSVASVDNMNTFMNDWVCQALENGTNYFWFEAFDEAWKVAYNEPGKEWEDKWGLMDTARNLKPGLQIPSCGGKTVS